jgi:lysozyme family protein
MKSTYLEAIDHILKDEGGYTNDAADPGGPTNWGITIEDARHYWKPEATAEDVKEMPQHVAEDIYQHHYADPLRYDDLPEGVDYAVLDYGVNSGINRAARVLQSIVGVKQDGEIGPKTIAACKRMDSDKIINAIYNERIDFLKSLHTWHVFGKGWLDRCVRGRVFAHDLITPKFTFWDQFKNTFNI